MDDCSVLFSYMRSVWGGSRLSWSIIVESGLAVVDGGGERPRRIGLDRDEQDTDDLFIAMWVLLLGTCIFNHVVLSVENVPSC